MRYLRAAGGLELTAGITAIVGDNGSGKSTLVEAIAGAVGLNLEGGSRSLRFSTTSARARLGQFTRVVRNPGRERRSYFLRAESFFNVATELERLDAGSSELLGAYGGRSLHHRSHGEAFLDLLRHRLGPRWLYLLDEPEAALSPQGCLAAVALIDELVRAGSQFVTATHSPILLAVPGTRILQIDDGELHEVGYDECRTVSVMRGFLASPERSLRHLLARE
ncbi:MAG: AAA family ATPase [Pseudonocardia sp.]